ncbi:hypothetical protein CPB86DRAFT_802644 [Serendipita vermifera]|nr:hypothetical protein CPB86DRAFT_802644 [Serendipita vermifera]
MRSQSTSTRRSSRSTAPLVSETPATTPVTTPATYASTAAGKAKKQVKTKAKAVESAIATSDSFTPSPPADLALLRKVAGVPKAPAPTPPLFSVEDTNADVNWPPLPPANKVTSPEVMPAPKVLKGSSAKGSTEKLVKAPLVPLSSPKMDEPALVSIHKHLLNAAKPVPAVSPAPSNDGSDDEEDVRSLAPSSPLTATEYSVPEPADCDWYYFQEAQGDDYSLTTDENSLTAASTMPGVQELPPPVRVVKKAGNAPATQSQAQPEAPPKPLVRGNKRDHSPPPNETRKHRRTNSQPAIHSGPSVSNPPPASSSFSRNTVDISNSMTASSSTANGTASVTTTTTTQITSTTATNAGTQADAHDGETRRRHPRDPKPSQVSYYPVAIQPFLTSVRDQYRFSLYQLGFFPTPDEKVAYCRESWNTAVDLWDPLNNTPPHAPLEFSTSIQSMCFMVGAEVRGQVKAKTASLLCHLFSLETPDIEATPAARLAFRKARAIEFLNERSFLYAPAWRDPKSNQFVDSVPYTHPAIAQIILQSFFQRSLKQLEKQALVPIPIPVIAIVCATIECSLEEYKDTGDLSPRPFTESSYLASYREYTSALNPLPSFPARNELFILLRLALTSRMTDVATPSLRDNKLLLSCYKELVFALIEYRKDPKLGHKGIFIWSAAKASLRCI